MADIFRIIKVCPLDCREVHPNTPQCEWLTGDVMEDAVNCQDHVVLVAEKWNTNMEHCAIMTGEWGNWCTWRKICPIVTLRTINPTQSGFRLYLGPHKTILKEHNRLQRSVYVRMEENWKLTSQSIQVTSSMHDSIYSHHWHSCNATIRIMQEFMPTWSTCALVCLKWYCLKMSDSESTHL
jgi:hypothetical protein